MRVIYNTLLIVPPNNVGYLSMIFHVANNQTIDTDTDLRPEERHILQKLLCWKQMADSIDQFRQKKESAFDVGWNNSGPVRERKVMTQIIEQLESEIRERLNVET